MKITKESLNDLRPKINDALEALGEELGIKITATNGKYSNGMTGQFKLEIASVGEDGEIFDKEAEDFKEMALLFDLKREWLGEEVQLGAHRFKITGLFASRPKNCVRILNLGTGRNHVCPATTIIQAMK